MFKRMANVNMTGLFRPETVLAIAAENGHEMVVKLLLKADADVNGQDPYGKTALHIAAQHGHMAVAKVLLQAKADVNMKDNHGWTATYYAAKKGWVAMVRLLVEGKADVEVKESRPSASSLGRAHAKNRAAHRFAETS